MSDAIHMTEYWLDVRSSFPGEGTTPRPAVWILGTGIS